MERCPDCGRPVESIFDHVDECPPDAPDVTTTLVIVPRKNCKDCKFWTYDMDEEYCAHPESFKESMYGRNLNYSRREGNFCGPEAKLFEER